MNRLPTLVTFTDSNQYVECIVPFLEINEVENETFFGLLDLIQSDPPESPPTMIQIKQGDATIGAAFYRDRHLVVTRDLKDVAEALATLLRERDIDVPGVAGPSSSAEQFAKAWSRIRGCESELTVEMGLYWLKTLIWPAPVAGHMRPMVTDDIPLVAQWVFEFQREATPHEAGNIDEARKNSEARPRQNMTFIWEVDGEAVCMAALSRPSKHGITVNAVYTPPEFRGRGYATALVAFVTNEGLKRGKEFCSLYTDLANPTSNSIYQKIGYELFSYSRVFRFTHS